MKVPMCSSLFCAVTGFLIIYTNLLVESYSASINTITISFSVAEVTNSKTAYYKHGKY